MRTKPSHLLLALLTVIPTLAAADAGNIVLPPAPPPGVAAAPVSAAKAPAPQMVAPTPVQSAPQNAQTNVMPPDSVSSAKPAATLTPQQDLIDVVLPAAPEKPPVSDLKPSAPKVVGAVKAKTKKPTKHVLDGEEVETKKAVTVDDPFAGVVGTPVSDSQLNRFVFPEPVEGVYFQEGAPLPDCGKDVGPQDPCKPVFLNGRKMMLLQLRAGAQGLVQMLVHLHSGRMVTLNLAPSRGPGAVVRIEGAEDGVSDSRLAEAKAQAKTAATGGMEATEQDVALLARFARGDIPGGYEAEPVGSPVRYDLFDVVPMATWSNGGPLRAHLMQVRPHGDAPVAINPGLFRSANVRALALDRDTITAKAPAILYILEQTPTEAQ
ncbi:TraK domain-containing protein [Novimethylophilus kurashikiensis]|uniref:TraK domain-containing protein n=1 Tax=Novimethylophilus kurashikiensis TaxID=1825523 RepID=UPI000D598659|nr:type-F conjugative transfer system secretin TraK [Novimethylophilus kurashikiensis]